MRFSKNDIVKKNEKGVVTYYIITDVNSSNYHGIKGRFLGDYEKEFCRYPYSTNFQQKPSCRDLLKQYFCIKERVIEPISEDNLEIVGTVNSDNIHREINEAFEKK